jgi:pilus assembly protein CpaF
MFGWARGDGLALSPVEDLKRAIHRQLIERLDLAALEALEDEAQLTLRIRQAVAELLRGETTPLSQAEREALVEEVVYEVIGLGPIEPFFRDRSVSDILVNGPRDIYVERGGRLERVPGGFRDNAHLLAVIDRIVSRVGRRIDESSPMVDARLPDGSRVNAIIAPLAVDAPVLSIRRFGAGLGADQLAARGAFTEDMQQFLRACVRARLNILVSGGTGSGKTTLLNALSACIPDSERIITIEDAAELRLQQAHVVRLETRPPNAEGRGEVTMRDLVKNALRMRPDRIIIGEVRAGEALDMLQAMNTGHEGSLTTVHANTPRDAIGRLETMVRFAGADVPDRAVREQVASAIDLIVQASRLADGTRRVVSISEVGDLTPDGVEVRELFRFRRDGVRADGTVEGVFEACGELPRCLERLAVAGVPVAASLFARSTRGAGAAREVAA